DNQLYRVEIHVGGRLGAGSTDQLSFKWSRDNGSVLAEWVDDTSVGTNKIRVARTTRDEALGFQPDQWIELTDERRRLATVGGIVVKLKTVDGDVLEYDPTTASEPGKTQSQISFVRPPSSLKPKVRRWDSPGVPAVQRPTTNDGYLALED